MSNESDQNQCPKCAAAIPAGAPQGLCPKCLLAQVSLGTDTGRLAEGKPAPPALEAVAAAFPQLEILELIGQGGMGAVFKARQPKLDRLVALKILPQTLAADPAFAERFIREGRMLARLNHPNIVTVHDFGQASGLFYLLMEFVDGVNLRQAMRGGRFSPAQALAVVPKICDALQYAHGEGILHRDIKPENILLDARSRVKIADFGIAKLLTEPLSGAALTASGARLGTPHYMAPEQIEKPGAVDHRADIYSLGVVFYEMLTGELPLGRFAAPSEKTAIDPRLDEVVFRSLEKERERRQQSAAEVKTQVETIATGAAPPASKTETPRLDPTRETTTPRNPQCDGTVGGFRVVEEREGRAEVHWPGAIQAWAWLFYILVIGALPVWLLSRMSLHLLVPIGFLTILSSALLSYYFINQARRRYQPGLAPKPSPQRPPLPRWTDRVSKLILVIAGLSVLRTVWMYQTSELGRVVLTVPLELLLIPTAVALRTRNREWRQAATLGCGFLIILTAAAWAATVYASGAGRFPEEGITAGAAFIAVVTSLVASLVAPLSLWTLWHREVQPCFGDTVLSATVSMAAAQGAAAEPTSNPDALAASATNPWPRRLFRFVGVAVGVFVLVFFTSVLLYSLARRRADRAEPTRMAFREDLAGNELPIVPTLAPAPAAPIRNNVPTANAESPEPAANVGTAQTPQSWRTFNLRHKLADEMADSLAPFVLRHPSAVAQSASNNQEITVIAPAAILNRLATFIAVTDWPTSVKNEPTGGYRREDPIAAARSFFHACALENLGEVERMLSTRLIAQVSGRAKDLPEAGYDGLEETRVAELRATWPGKDAALRSLARAWTKYPLRQLRQELPGGVSLGPRCVVSASFEGAPEESLPVNLETAKHFTTLEFIRERNQATGQPLVLDTLPPWMGPMEKP